MSYALYMSALVAAACAPLVHGASDLSIGQPKTCSLVPDTGTCNDYVTKWAWIEV
jgi:hypothetical protein